MTHKKILINSNDLDTIMPTKEQYLKGLKQLCKGGWNITAERCRKYYNRLCIDKKNKILKDELGEKLIK